MEFWSVADSERGILITCRGHDREAKVGVAVATFEAIAVHKARFTIIADLREMTGYESASRVAWQESFRRHRQKIHSLVLVGARSALIRMGAAAVGAFAGIPVRFVQSLEELEALERRAPPR